MLEHIYFDGLDSSFEDTCRNVGHPYKVVAYTDDEYHVFVPIPQSIQYRYPDELRERGLVNGEYPLTLLDGNLKVSEDAFTNAFEKKIWDERELQILDSAYHFELSKGMDKFTQHLLDSHFPREGYYYGIVEVNDQELRLSVTIPQSIRDRYPDEFSQQDFVDWKYPLTIRRASGLQLDHYEGMEEHFPKKDLYYDIVEMHDKEVQVFVPIPQFIQDRYPDELRERGLVDGKYPLTIMRGSGRKETDDPFTTAFEKKIWDERVLEIASTLEMFDYNKACEEQAAEPVEEETKKSKERERDREISF